MDEASVVAAMGRRPTATVSFEIDEEGRPDRFQVEAASDERWGPEAIEVLRSWRFLPGLREGRPVPVACALTLAWGERNIGAKAMQLLSERIPPNPSFGLPK